MYEVIIHMQNEDPILADMDKLPDPTHLSVTVTNPRRRDGKPLTYVTEGAQAFVFPWSRISFIEVMGGEEVEKEIEEFFRE
ncbi:MAG: hypothetical protein JXM73_25605 [Anaerolineae bacterium]|nr:hypothetical protein [Anaerolineae bacterium]